MRMLFGAVVGLGLTLQPALAQSESADRDSLNLIYMLTISQEICNLELSDAQSTAIGAASDKLEEKLGLSEEDSQKLYDQITASLEKQKESGLCNPKGEWVKTYKEALQKYAK